MQQITARIVERGNGYPDIGEWIIIDDIVYTVIDYVGPIHTDRLGGNYHYASIEYHSSIWEISEAEYDDIRSVRGEIV